MRSKKVLVIVVALVACLAIGSATVATAKTKKKKITSTITLSISSTPANTTYAPYSPGSATYSGQVKAKGPAGCKKGRVVSIFRNGAQVDGSVLTGPGGFYNLTQQLAPAPGTYTATVAKRVIKKKKKNKKFICKAATSNAVVVP